MKKNKGIVHIFLIVIGIIIILVLFGFFSVKRSSGSVIQEVGSVNILNPVGQNK